MGSHQVDGGGVLVAGQDKRSATVYEHSPRLQGRRPGCTNPDSVQVDGPIPAQACRTALRRTCPVPLCKQRLQGYPYLRYDRLQWDKLLVQMCLGFATFRLMLPSWPTIGLPSQ